MSERLAIAGSGAIACGLAAVAAGRGHVTVFARSDGSCDKAQGGLFRIWQLPLGATEDIGPGWADQLTVVDVAGHSLVIQSSGPANATDADKRDVNSIINSLVIKP